MANTDSSAAPSLYQQEYISNLFIAGHSSKKTNYLLAEDVPSDKII
jgi:hypothetical protein